MKIEINLLNNKILAEGVQGEQVNKVIDGFFDLLALKNGREQDGATVKPKTSADIEKSVSTFVPPFTPSAPKLVQKAVETKQENTVIPKVLPKIDDQRTLNPTIGELVGELVTPLNIRLTDDGIKLYQTQYTCDCGHAGKRFIRETNDYTKCHNCGEKLLIEPATLEDDVNGIPKPDVDGNFFIARELYEVE